VQMSVPCNMLTSNASAVQLANTLHLSCESSSLVLAVRSYERTYDRNEVLGELYRWPQLHQEETCPRLHNLDGQVMTYFRLSGLSR
jgi:hypothetical protein